MATLSSIGVWRAGRPTACVVYRLERVIAQGIRHVVGRVSSTVHTVSAKATRLVGPSTD